MTNERKLAAREIAHRIEQELARPGSSWRVWFPDAAWLCELYDMGEGTIWQALGLLGARGLLVLRWIRAGDPLVDWPGWVPPAQAGPAYSFAAGLAQSITSGRLIILPSAAQLALACGVDRATALWALHRLVAWGLATPTRPHRAAAWRWELTPGPGTGHVPGVAASEPTAEHVATELTRRLRTGWYEWSGCDGRRYTRPFPSVESIADQFACSLDTAAAAMRSLGLDIPDDAGHTDPDPARPHPPRERRPGDPPGRRVATTTSAVGEDHAT